MKKKSFFILVAVLFTIGAFAQSTATTKPMSFSITKEVRPPLWEIVEEPHFVDANGNNVIDANEECKIVMKLKNIGQGDGLNLSANISAMGDISGISYANRKIDNIAVGRIAVVEFPLTTNINTVNGNVSFEVYVKEPLGFNTDKYVVKVHTRAFQSPMVEVKDYVVSGKNGGKLEKMKPFQLQILIQNTQYGLAENISVSLKYPENVYSIEGQKVESIPQLSAGEFKTLTYSLLINNQYNNATLPITIELKEKYGKYAQNKTITLELNQTLTNRSIDVVAQVVPQANIADVQLRSEVDRNIPQIGLKNTHKYAIIIGNEDYHSYQKDLNSEQDVSYAVEDANVFKQYCQKTLGIDEQNIVLLSNATAAKMNQEIDWITRLVARDNQAEIVFYYAGHGFPDENTKEPYLIPVDVNASNLGNAISLYGLYEKLTATGAKRVTVFLDACFSGGGRNAGLIASRGIRVTPKKDVLSGNIVIFSATSADQTALPYKEKQHGMFTYFLLKKLQDSKGNCSYSEMYEYLNKNVGDNSLRVNRKEQNPEVNTSAQVQDKWRTWMFN